MGGVVVHWNGIAALSEMTGLSIAEVKQAFANSKIAGDFERGLCSGKVFIPEFRKIFNLSGTDAELSSLWNSWVGAPYDGIVDAIGKLKRKFRVACLSNTNHLHWEHLGGYLNLGGLFHPAYASHEINLAKPDTDCFQYVIDDLKALPDEILFLDDSAANVKSAGLLGMQTALIDPSEGALPTLKKLGLLNQD